MLYVQVQEVLAHLMNGEPKPMRMPSYSKKKSNAGMIRGYKNVLESFPYVFLRGYGFNNISFNIDRIT